MVTMVSEGRHDRSKWTTGRSRSAGGSVPPRAPLPIREKGGYHVFGLPPGVPMWGKR